MDGTTPSPSPSDGLDEIFAALSADRDVRSCRAYTGDLRTKFGACDTQRETAAELTASAKLEPSGLVAVMKP
jgi:hypothetical protein